MGAIILPLLIILLLVLLNGLFVAAEFALVGAPRTAVERRADEGDPRARLVRRLLHNPRLQDRYIATAQLGITGASLGLGMYGEHVLAEWLDHALSPFFEQVGLSRWLAAHAVASVLAVTLLTYVHIVLGEMVPKSLALQRAEATVLAIARPMQWIKALLYPLVIALNGIGNALLRLVGVDRQTAGHEQYHTPEELEYIVQESQAGGLLQEESGNVLRELFEFGDRTAHEVMVPRVRVTGIPVGATPDAVRDILRRSRHTRYPVYDGDLDHLLGAVHIKDVLRLLLEARPLAARDARPLPYVPEAATLDAVLRAMRRQGTQLSVVLDEYGGTAGIVTLEDLFEEVIGPMEDGATPLEIAPDGAAGGLRVAGTVRLDEVGEALGVPLEHAEVDTVGGLVLTLLGRPPRVGDIVQSGRVRFEVTAVQGRGVQACNATLLSEPEGAALGSPPP